MSSTKFSEVLKFSRPLRAHQIAALDRFALEREMFLTWEMGVGKSTSAIAWLRAKYTLAKEITPTLIVSPVATLYNWLEEFKINAPEKVVNSVAVPYMRTRKTKYTGKQRAEFIKTTDKKIIVINPESLDMSEVVAALRVFAPVNIVIDEVHRWKGHAMGSDKKPSRLKNLLSISDKAQNCTVMTGTPILNNYMDIWAQFRILDRGATFGTNFFSHFRERYFHDENARWRGKEKYFPKYVPRPGIETEIAEKMAAKTSRITKLQCLDLPPLTFEERFVELSEQQEKAYRELEKELVTEIREGTCAVTNALSKTTRLLQILSGFMTIETDEGSKLSVQLKNPRLELLKELLEELTPNHKVIVWASYRESYPMLRKICEELSLEHAEITGDIKDKRSEELRFQSDPKCRVLIGNAQAGGVGINLTAASYAIYFSRNYSLGDRLQSEARNHRGGSEIHDNITIIDIVAKHTLDEAVLEALKRKQDFSDNILKRIADNYRMNTP